MSRILIVDDSPVEIKIIRRLLGTEYDILEATNGRDAIELANNMMPDLILLDIVMQGMDGLTVCKVLKSQPETADIPVIFITAVSGSRDIVKGFDVGGQDYITKPFYSPELCARIKVHLELKKSKETVKNYSNELEAKNLELNQLLAKLEASAMTDYGTGLANRRSAMRWIKAEAAGIKQHQRKATLLLADIDNFKKVNDTYGHDCGDAVLKTVAALMQSVVREETVIARWGGEEFLLILPDAELAGGLLVAERIRKAVEAELFSYHEHLISVTLTLGVAELDPVEGFDASIKKADEALYRGKHMSKNCVVAYE